jgi:hypothetical protein
MNIDLGNMGIQALKSHAKGKLHDTKLKEASTKSNFIKPNSSSSSTSSVTSVETSISSPVDCNAVDLTSTTSLSQSTIPSNFHDGGKSAAEIRWILKHILSGYSDHSCKETLQPFIATFPDSLIAAEMELRPGKLKCITNHGLAPHFKSMLKTDVTTSEWVVASFNESLNSQ